jgi:hypothetical protein
MERRKKRNEKVKKYPGKPLPQGATCAKTKGGALR